jgi:hypothetical protein
MLGEGSTVAPSYVEALRMVDGGIDHGLRAWCHRRHISIRTGTQD